MKFMYDHNLTLTLPPTLPKSAYDQRCFLMAECATNITEVDYNSID